MAKAFLPKLVFTVVIQKSWKLMVKQRNGKEKKETKRKSTSTFLLSLLALEAAIVVMVIKLQTSMKVYIAVIAI